MVKMSHVSVSLGVWPVPIVYIGMFVDTYFKIACSFTNISLITSTCAYVYYV